MAITIIIIIIWSVGTSVVCTVLSPSFFERGQPEQSKLYSLVVVFVVADSRRIVVVNAPKSQQILSRFWFARLVSQCPLLVLLFRLIAQAQCSARLAAC